MNTQKDFNFLNLLQKVWNTQRDVLMRFAGFFLIYFAVSLFSELIFKSKHLSFIMLLMGIFAYIIQFWFVLGLTKMSIKITRKEKIGVEDFYFDILFVIRYLGLSILVFVVCFLFTLLFLVPGIIAILALCMSTWLFIDTEMDILDAMSLSRKITDGYKWRLLGLFLLIFGFNLLGILFFGIGILVTAPLSILIMADIYCQLSDGHINKVKSVLTSDPIVNKENNIVKRPVQKKTPKQVEKKIDKVVENKQRKVVKKVTTKTDEIPKKTVKKAVHKKKASIKK